MADPSFLIDSNICIYLLDGSSPEARARFEALEPRAVATSAIVYAEVMLGVASTRPEGERAAARLFDLVTVLPFDRAAASIYRHLRFRRGSFDRLIAAHALALDLTLITNNEGDFADIPGLRTENWTLPA